MSTVMTDSEARAGALPDEFARKKLLLYVSLVAGVVLADQVTKLYVERTMFLHDPQPVIGEWFRLTFIYNRGAAFGLHVGEWSRFFFLALAVVAVVALGFLYRATPWTDRTRLYAIAGVTAGALGNMIDRMRSSRGVVDFFDVGIPGGARWPVFNIADIFVTCGALILAFSLWREEQHEAKPADGSQGG